MYWSYVFLALNHRYIHEPPILHCTCKCPDINSHSADYEVRKVFLQDLQVPWQQGSWGQHRAHLGPVGPSCTPCRPDEPCYMGLSPCDITQNAQQDPKKMHDDSNDKTPNCIMADYIMKIPGISILWVPNKKGVPGTHKGNLNCLCVLPGHKNAIRNNAFMELAHVIMEWYWNIQWESIRHTGWNVTFWKWTSP